MRCERGSRFPQGQAGANQMPLLIELDPFKSQHPQLPVTMGDRRTVL